MSSVVPAALLLLGGVVQPLLPARVRGPAFLVWPALALAAILGIPDGARVTLPLLGRELVLLDMDALSRVFGIVFALTGLIGGIFALHVREKGQQAAALLYGAGALGVTFAGDFLTLLCFWELMAVASVWLVFARRTPGSRKAGLRYLGVHLAGGALLMAGILVRGDLAIGPIAPDGAGWGAWLVLAGVLLNAAFPPLHAWLPDAYPRATVTGAIFLSAFTTKSAVYVLARVFPGWELLVAGGVVMALYGVVYAVLVNDIRRILAYHIVSQVGYMVCAVGIGTELAINGAAAHAFCHVLYKGFLFMGAGVVIQTTGESDLHRLGGFWRRQKLTVFLFMIAAFSISGVPLFNGFVSKAAIVAAAFADHREAVGLLLLLASVGTFLHTGLKIPYFTWFGEDRGIEPRPAPRNMHVAMVAAAVLCIATGVWPQPLYRLLPHAMDWWPYTAHHVGETVQILVFTFVSFWLLRGKLAGRPVEVLDTDWLYRRPLRVLGDGITAVVGGGFDRAGRSARRIAAAAQRWLADPVAAARGIDRHVHDADDDRPTIGVAALIALGLVAVLALWVAS